MSHSESAAIRPVRTRPGRSRLGMLAAVPALLVLGLDQLTKAWVESHLRLGERVDVLGPVLQWHFIKNPGVAFSIGENKTWIATLLASVITIAVLVLVVRSRHPLWSFAGGLIAGGALGNLTDRLFREPGFGIGHVVDFIAVGTFPRFNIADSAVCVGVGIVMILLFRGIDPWPMKPDTDSAADGRDVVDAAQDSAQSRLGDGQPMTDHTKETST